MCVGCESKLKLAQSCSNTCSCPATTEEHPKDMYVRRYHLLLSSHHATVPGSLCPRVFFFSSVNAHCVNKRQRMFLPGGAIDRNRIHASCIHFERDLWSRSTAACRKESHPQATCKRHLHHGFLIKSNLLCVVTARIKSSVCKQITNVLYYIYYNNIYLLRLMILAVETWSERLGQ